VDVTAITVDRRRGLGRLLGGAPPSGRAALFLAVSMFLCGCVVAGLLFVGIWRHTASQAADSQAAQQRDRQHLLAAESTLAELKAQLVGLKAQLARNQLALARAKTRAAHATSQLVQARNAGRAITTSLAPSLQELIRAGETLARQTATMESELTALETYARDPGAVGLDAGYLESQIGYVARSASAASSQAAALARHSQDVQAALTAHAHGD
jgi:chromosome segregation ATPase